MNTEKITDRCREVLLLLSAGNQLQAARELGLSQSVVNRVANGKRKPSRAFLEKVAAHERVNAAFLFEGDGDPLLPIYIEIGRDVSKIPEMEKSINMLRKRTARLYIRLRKLENGGG
jgi:transcriptional regulator with XRE-family HTH domain